MYLYRVFLFFSVKHISLYDIYYSIDIDQLTFSGHQVIHGDSQRGLWLNAKNVNVSTIMLNGKIVPFLINTEEEIVNIDENYNGPFELTMDFYGNLSESMYGLYYSKEKEGIFVSSHFGPTGARMAFPCVDRPDVKSRFKLTLNIPEDYEGVSNMPAVSAEIQSGRKIISFDVTPPMSTYLLYVGAGKYDVLKEKYGDKPLYLTSSRGKFVQTELPLAIASQTIKFYEHYFDIEYSLPKLHLIAVPDFAFGAMENWGAITFREIRLMIGEDTSLSIMKIVDQVISHELAHQWFGDLVTMKWWDDIWLNESFATFMSYKAMESKHSDWDIMREFVTEEMGGALTGDSLRNTHPIHVDVTSPDDIQQIFDEISYGKGASILRMLEGYVGPEPFRQGVIQYLNKHEYSNAEGHELWESIEKTSEKPVAKIMDAWIGQPGYPIIEATINGNNLKLRQTRFFLDGSSDQALWPIPVNVQYSSGVQEYLMKNETMDIPLKEFQHLNPQRTGFYRIRYDEETWQIVLGNIEFVDVISRWGFISDAYALYLGRQNDLNHLILILQTFMHDGSFIVRNEITKIISQLHNILINSKRIDDFAIEYLNVQLEELSDYKDDESINTTVIRGRIQTALSLVDLTYASKLSSSFNEFMNVKPDGRLAVAIGYARTMKDFEGLRKMYLKTAVDEDRVKILTAMGHLTGEAMMQKGFEFIYSKDVKKQDFFALINAALTEDRNRPYILKNIDKILETMDNFFAGTGMTSRFLEVMIPYLGLYNETAINKYISRTNKASWDKGIKKGLEYLNIYQHANGK